MKERFHFEKEEGQCGEHYDRQIMLLVRDSETKPLWTEYREDGTVFETDDMDALVEKVKELFDRYTRNQLRVVQDMSYTLDILFD